MPAELNLVFAVVAAGILVATPVVVVLAERRRRARQHADFVATYGTVEAAKATVDNDMLRELRDRKGPVEAVRALRKAHPGIPLNEAAQIIKSL